MVSGSGMTETEMAEAVLDGLALCCKRCGSTDVVIPANAQTYLKAPDHGIQYVKCRSCGYSRWFWPTGERAYMASGEWIKGDDLD